MSIEGYSFGVTFFDVVGSAGNAAVYFMREAVAGMQEMSKTGDFCSDLWERDMQEVNR